MAQIRDRRAVEAPSIQGVVYNNPRRPELALEVLALAELRRKAPVGYLARPQRPTFHQLLLPTSGQCVHEVDFERVKLSPGTLAWIRPGQVQRFDLDREVEGWLVLFAAEFLESGSQAASLDEPMGSRIDLGGAAGDVAWLVERLRRISEDLTADLMSTRRLLHHLLHALLLILRRCGRSGDRDDDALHGHVFLLFRIEVERRFAEMRSAQDYARIIGYSPKTLARATHAATGLSAKAYINQRVLLEGKRLLAHTDANTVEIASRLGFSEPTNFIKFFQREAGESPSAFRTRSRSAPRR